MPKNVEETNIDRPSPTEGLLSSICHQGSRLRLQRCPRSSVRERRHDGTNIKSRRAEHSPASSPKEPKGHLMPTLVHMSGTNELLCACCVHRHRWDALTAAPPPRISTPLVLLLLLSVTSHVPGDPGTACGSWRCDHQREYAPLIHTALVLLIILVIAVLALPRRIRGHFPACSPFGCPLLSPSHR